MTLMGNVLWWRRIRYWRHTAWNYLFKIFSVATKFPYRYFCYIPFIGMAEQNRASTPAEGTVTLVESEDDHVHQVW